MKIELDECIIGHVCWRSRCVIYALITTSQKMQCTYQSPERLRYHTQSAAYAIKKNKAINFFASANEPKP